MKSKNKLKSNPSRLSEPGQRVSKSASWRADKQSSSARGYTYEWQQARDEYLRANPLCVMCWKRGRVQQATVVDHVIPHHGNDALFWNRDNWQSLCATCHSKHKQRVERATATGSKSVNVHTRVKRERTDDATHACDAKAEPLTNGEGGGKVRQPVDT